jgi:hypothetical protein
MIILGINAYHGDAAAAIIEDGKLIAAVEEERFNRFKHCAGFPTESIRYCLKAAGIEIADVDHVGISRDPSAHLHKKILFAATRAARQLTGGRGDTAGGSGQTGGHGDGGTGGQGEGQSLRLRVSPSPRLRVPASPRRPVSPSPRLHASAVRRWQWPRAGNLSPDKGSIRQCGESARSEG